MHETVTTQAFQCLPQAISHGQAITAVIKLLSLQLPLILFAIASARALFQKQGSAIRALAAFNLYFLIVGASLWVIPGIGFYRMLAFSLVLGAAGIVILRLCPYPEYPPAESKASFAPMAGIITAVLFSLCLLYKGVYHPGYDRDSLTYQLHFAASWLVDGKVSIIPTPFGDPSQAYGPALASFFYVWLLLPLGNDMLAATGAWSFMALTLLSGYCLARELGAARSAWAAMIFCLTSILFVHESTSALNDLLVAGLFCSSLFFFLRAFRQKNPRFLFMGIVSAGLMTGSKHTGATLLVLLVIPAAAALFRLRRPQELFWVIPGAALAVAGGCVWHLRNLLLTGNPFFPIRISVFGREIFPGLYGREQMLAWVFHREGPRAWLQAVELNASLGLLAVGILCMALLFLRGTSILTGRAIDDGAYPDSEVKPVPASPRLRGFLICYAALVPLLVDRLNWEVVPFQEERFWMSSVPVLAAVCAAALARYPLLLLAGFMASYLGLLVHFPALSLLDEDAWQWIVYSLPACALLGVLVSASYAYLSPVGGFISRLRSRPRWRLATMLFPVSGILVFLVISMPGHERRRDLTFSTYPFADAWRSVPCPDEGVTVAYTGSNLPYFLHGPRLRNRVIYITVSGHVGRSDHKFLEDLPPGAAFHTPEPSVSGLQLCRGRWLEALLDSGADFLFVTRVGRNELLNYAHTREGWPFEESWVTGPPSLFHVVYRGEHARVYLLDRMGSPPSFSRECEARPADAIAAMWEGQETLDRFFPLARPALADMGIAGPR